MKKFIHIAVCLLVLVQSLAVAAPMDCAPAEANPPCHEQSLDKPDTLTECEADCQHCQLSQPGLMGELFAQAYMPLATLPIGRLPSNLPDPCSDIDHPPNIPIA